MRSLQNGYLWRKKNHLKQRKTIIPSSIYTIVNLTLEKCNWNVFFFHFFLLHFCTKKTTHRIFIKSPSKYPHMQLYFFSSLTHSLDIYTFSMRPIQWWWWWWWWCDCMINDKYYSLYNDNDCVTHLKCFCCLFSVVVVWFYF